MWWSVGSKELKSQWQLPGQWPETSIWHSQLKAQADLHIKSSGLHFLLIPCKPNLIHEYILICMTQVKTTLFLVVCKYTTWSANCTETYPGSCHDFVWYCEMGCNCIIHFTWWHEFNNTQYFLVHFPPKFVNELLNYFTSLENNLELKTVVNHRYFCDFSSALHSSVEW